MEGAAETKPSLRCVSGGEEGQIRLGLRMSWIDLKGVAIRTASRLDLSTAGKHDTEVVPAVGILRIQLQGAVLFGECLFRLSVGVQDLSQQRVHDEVRHRRNNMQNLPD